MYNKIDEQSILNNVHKAENYHSYLMIKKTHPEITQLADNEILIQICELFESCIDKNTIDQGRFSYEYVVFGLIPTYELSGETSILNKCLKQLEVAESCSNDCDLLRDIYVAKAKVYMMLSQFSLAEKYILIAYNDYDYRKSTFSLLMKVLDSQNKFELMIHYLKQYCGKFANLHSRLQHSDLNVDNIKSSNYMDQFNKIMEV